MLLDVVVVASRRGAIVVRLLRLEHCGAVGTQIVDARDAIRRRCDEVVSVRMERQ